MANTIQLKRRVSGNAGAPAALKSGDFGMTAAQRDQAYLDAQIKGEAAGLSPNEARAQALGGIPAMNAQSQQLALSQADTARRIAHEGRARKKQEVKEDFDAVTGAIDAGKDYFYSGLEESGPALADMEGTDLAVGKSSAADMAKAHGASQSYIDMAKGHGAPGY